jgi:cleavage and polyadenylation specificity factor subunit 1
MAQPSVFFMHWISRFGPPKTITTDQGTQLESTLFKALANLVGAKRIHTAPYHSASNELIERWHRSLKAAIMCHRSMPWIELLPTVLLGLRTCIEEDIKASAAELLYGMPLGMHGELFANNNMPADLQIFGDKFREHMRELRLTPAAHHIKSNMFILKDLYTCSHVFLRTDAMKSPLQPPYTGPYQVVKRLGEFLFVIRVEGKEITISTEKLKPVYRKRTRRVVQVAV